MGYQKEVYDRAWGMFSARAVEVKKQNESRRAEIRAAIPEIEQIERRMAAAAAAVTRCVIAEPSRATQRIEELGRQNLELQSRRRELLLQKGYPEDYLDERFACPQCRDKGYVGSRRCRCLEGLIKQAATAQLGAVSRACHFSDFSLHYYPDSEVDAGGASPRRRMGQILEFCRQYAAGFTPRSDSMLFLGQTGLGKTHLSLAIASDVVEAGYGVVYVPVHKLMNRLEAEKFSRSDGRENYTDSIDLVTRCDLLVLDDLGTEFHTQFTASALYNIINTRLTDEKPTIINTNLELPQIEEKYSQRMVSRLVCSCRVLKFCGKDIRYIKKAERRA